MGKELLLAMQRFNGNKTPKIFISHATVSKRYAKIIIDLLNAIGVPKSKNNIICSSVNGYRIPLNENIYDYLRDQFMHHDLLVLFLLSPEYYKSAASLNEMGAAWILQNDYRAILLPGFDYKDITGAIDPRAVSMKLDDETIKDHLEDFKEQIERKFKLTPISHLIWEENRDKFIENIQNIPIPLSAPQDKQIIELENRILFQNKTIEELQNKLKIISTQSSTYNKTDSDIFSIDNCLYGTDIARFLINEYAILCSKYPKKSINYMSEALLILKMISQANMRMTIDQVSLLDGRDGLPFLNALKSQIESDIKSNQKSKNDDIFIINPEVKGRFVKELKKLESLLIENNDSHLNSLPHGSIKALNNRINKIIFNINELWVNNSDQFSFDDSIKMTSLLKRAEEQGFKQK